MKLGYGLNFQANFKSNNAPTKNGNAHCMVMKLNVCRFSILMLNVALQIVLELILIEYFELYIRFINFDIGKMTYIKSMAFHRAKSTQMLGISASITWCSSVAYQNQYEMQMPLIQKRCDWTSFLFILAFIWNVHTFCVDMAANETLNVHKSDKNWRNVLDL